MRTCFLIHAMSKSELPPGNWREPPWKDDDRILVEPDDPATVDNIYHEGAAIAKIDSFGVLLRGKHNPNDSWLPLLRRTAEAHPYGFRDAGHAPPTFFPFFDTGALPDLGGATSMSRIPSITRLCGMRCSVHSSRRSTSPSSGVTSIRFGWSARSTAVPSPADRRNELRPTEGAVVRTRPLRPDRVNARSTCCGIQRLVNWTGWT